MAFTGFYLDPDRDVNTLAFGDINLRFRSGQTSLHGGALSGIVFHAGTAGPLPLFQFFNAPWLEGHRTGVKHLWSWMKNLEGHDSYH